MVIKIQCRSGVYERMLNWSRAVSDLFVYAATSRFDFFFILINHESTNNYRVILKYSFLWFVCKFFICGWRKLVVPYFYMRSLRYSHWNFTRTQWKVKLVEKTIWDLRKFLFLHWSKHMWRSLGSLRGLSFIINFALDSI